jgi:hypothetical protein
LYGCQVVTIEPLTILDLKELEGCQALQQRRGTTLPQLLDAWRRSPVHRDVAFRKAEYGAVTDGSRVHC